jgi:hypothetical protein
MTKSTGAQRAKTKKTEPAPADKPRAKLDLVKGEALFRAGLSLEAIGSKCGVSKQAVDKAAKKLGWKRDLTQRVADAVDRKLTEVDAAVDEAHAQEDEAIVKAAALARADVVVSHRKDIRNASSIVGLLMDQLQSVAVHRESIEDLIEEDTKDDRTTQRRTAMLRAVALPTHAGVIRDLSAAMKNLIGLDREAHGLDKAEGGDKAKGARTNTDDVLELDDGDLLLIARKGSVNADPAGSSR